MTDTDLLFVYGSLRAAAGHAMGAWLRERAVACGAATVVGRLHAVGWYPALVAGEGVVHGELYRLRCPDETLAALDAYEGISGGADDEYRRVLLPVQPAAGAVVPAWAYLWCRPVAGLAAVPSGDWLRRG